MTELPTYVLEREFDAPRPLVWRAWTEADLLGRWYGPNVETVTHRLDLEPGGLWLLEMRWGDGGFRQRIEYVEVEAPSRLVWLHSNADEAWDVVPSPMMENWPRVLLTTVTFTEVGERTAVRLTWVPHEASAAEIAAFEGAIAGLDKGWGAGMELLSELLAELQG